MKHGTVRVVHYDEISAEGPYREERRILLLYRVRIQGQMMGMNERYYARAASPKENRKFGDVPFT